MIELDVEDHGSGTDAAAPRRGLGIIAMRERAEMLGGTVEFLRPPEGGTLVRLTVPFDRLAGSVAPMEDRAGFSDVADHRAGSSEPADRRDAHGG